MTRFTLPVVCLFAAISVLIVGAFGGLPSWQTTWSSLDASISAVSSDVVRASSPVAPAADANDAARREAQDLRATIDKETQQLAALRASADQARRDLAALREQRQNEQTTVAQAKVVTKTEDKAAVPAPAPDATAAPRSGAVETSGAAAPATKFEVVAKPGVTPATVKAEQPMAEVPARQRQLAAQRLEAARTALTAGRRIRARRLLRMARAQMTQWPSASGQPDGSPATTVENAIGLINRGDRDGAVRAIDQVLAEASYASDPPRRSD